MPTTRRQSAIAEGKIKLDEQNPLSTTWKGRRPSKGIKHEQSGLGGESEGSLAGMRQGKKRKAEQVKGEAAGKEHLPKKSRFGTDSEDKSEVEDKQRGFKPGSYFGHLCKIRN
jgi:hypothetical protein